MTTTIDSVRGFNALIGLCVKTFKETGLEMGADIAGKLEQAPPLQAALEIQCNDLPFSPAISAMDGNPFQSALGQMMPFLDWNFREPGDWTLYTPNAPIDRAKFGWIELAGPTGVIKADTLSMGFYWQAPETKYPKHRHNAEELYYILSGDALWYSDSGGEQIRKPGNGFVHTSMEDHATATKTAPMLAMWAWRGDLGSDSYSKDSD